MSDLLLVEDNLKIQEVNKFILERSGYKVRLAMDLAEARRSVKEAEPDLIVLDIMLPDGNGLDYLKELRNDGFAKPVLLLTAKSALSDEIKGLQEGGNDYITKPYDNDLLLARIKNLLGMAKQADERVKSAVAQAMADGKQDVMVFGPLTVNSTAQRAFLGGADANLTPKEFALLSYFLRNIDKQGTAEEIYEAVWGLGANSSINTLRVHIKELRRKLKMDEAAPIIIETVKRKHYVCRATAAGK